MPCTYLAWRRMRPGHHRTHPSFLRAQQVRAPPSPQSWARTIASTGTAPVCSTKKQVGGLHSSILHHLWWVPHHTLLSELCKEQVSDDVLVGVIVFSSEMPVSQIHKWMSILWRRWMWGEMDLGTSRDASFRGGEESPSCDREERMRFLLWHQCDDVI